MAQEPKVGIPDRVREVLAGPPRNAELQAAILERARAQLVLRYRKHPAGWPNGIDHAGDCWYGDGSDWTQERIKRALSDEAFGEKPRVKPKVVVPEEAVVKVGRPEAVNANLTLSALKPWEKEGLTRRTWYRRREKPERGEP